MLKSDLMTNNIQKFLSRTNLSIPIIDYLKQVVSYFNLGMLYKFEFIEQGYEDVNIKIYTSSGDYVIKMFNKNRSLPRIKSIIKGLNEFHKIGIPTTELISFNKKCLYQSNQSQRKIYSYVTKFFKGNNLLQQQITKRDLLELTKFLAKINTLNFPITYDYDSWGIANILLEFDKKKSSLSIKELNLIEAIVESFKKIDFHLCSKSVIHGDMQKQHVLKNNQGQYCILDLGCLNYDYVIFDLAVFIAEFCTDYSQVLDFKNIYADIIKTYSQIKRLSEYELSIIPFLISAHYAIYFITTNYLIKTQNDTSRETKDWYDFSKKGLELSDKWFLTN